MTVRELLSDARIVRTRGDVDAAATGIAYDSRRVRAGDVFFGLNGRRADGHAFVRQALEAGAVAAVVERDIDLPDATVLEVEEARTAMAQAAARFHGFPSRMLRVAGVTGTNGKTTTTWLLESVFRAAGWRTGVIGTTGVRIGDERRDASFTTPEAPELQGLLREMADRGVRGVAIEVSSHALDQRRSYSLECDAAIFTNLTQDHLDFHGTMDAYLDAKCRLFDGRNGPNTKRATAIVNADDPAAPAIRTAARRGGLAEMLYGARPGAPHEPLHVHASRVDPVADGLRLRFDVDPAPGRSGIRSGENAIEFHLPLLGRYNAANAAAAFTAAMALDLPPAVIVRGLKSCAAVPGRLERVLEGQPFTVAVDYAHTPDALAQAIAALRDHSSGRILTVFGCGGDRDRGKRPVMGGIAAAKSDVAWVTSDNPRSEDPAAIAAEIVAGAPEGALRVELDRAGAIAAALAEARPGDAVLIAGKGHETTQTFADRTVPFDDRAEARARLRKGTSR